MHACDFNFQDKHFFSFHELLHFHVSQRMNGRLKFVMLDRKIPRVYSIHSYSGILLNEHALSITALAANLSRIYLV